MTEPVSVSLYFDAVRNQVVPRFVIWNHRVYRIEKIGLHHPYREGKTLYHVFSVVTKTLFMRLVLNTENLHWKLEEISDALPD